MKKKVIAAIAAVFLIAGCGSKKREDPEITPDTRESVSIREIDFTQADAEKVMKSAVAKHCGKVACKVTSVRISGADISGTYTYEIGSDEKKADAVLHDVSVNPNDKTVYTAAREDFKDNIPEIDEGGEEDPKKDDKPDEQKDDKQGDDKEDMGKNNFDIPDHVDENEEGARDDQKVYDENGIQIWRIYTNKGRIEFTGTYSGDSKFNIQIMDLKQNIKGQPVDMKQAGDIDGMMKLEGGYYYIKIEAAGGWSLYWNRIYE